MGLGKQAKILSKVQQEAVLSFLETTQSPNRNKLIFLLSARAGLRAKEISNLTWSMITDSTGRIGEAIHLQDIASKGTSGGVIWLNKDLKVLLVKYLEEIRPKNFNNHVIVSNRDNSLSAQQVVNMFSTWYKKLGFTGCSSHSGRRTFITNAARKISTVGGSLRDVQALARHSSLQMTQKYIECDVDSQKRVVQLI